MNKKINGIYTSMDIDMLLDFLEAHEDLYIVVDTKENYYSDDYWRYMKSLLANVF